MPYPLPNPPPQQPGLPELLREADAVTVIFFQHISPSQVPKVTRRRFTWVNTAALLLYPVINSLQQQLWYVKIKIRATRREDSPGRLQ